MSDTHLLFESLIIRQPTFHQTSLSLSIYIFIKYFFLLPYFHYNISQSLHIRFIFIPNILSEAQYTHTHTHAYILFYLHIQYPYTPVSLSTFIDHLNPFSQSLSLTLLPFTIMYYKFYCVILYQYKYIIYVSA